MRDLLYTGFNEAFRPLASLTIPLMIHYAIRHGLDFRYYTNSLIDSNDGIYWTKFIVAPKLFEEGYEKIIWLDVDQRITNMDYQLPETRTGLHVSKDWGDDAMEPEDFSVCGFICHKDAEGIINSVLRLELGTRDEPFPEQAPLRYLYKTFPVIRDQITVHPRKLFNCVPNEICPDRVPEPWRDGDFAQHLTMLKVEDRVRLFHEL